MSWRGRIRFVGGVGEGRMEGRRGEAYWHYRGVERKWVDDHRWAGD